MGKWLVVLAWPAISKILGAVGIGTLTFLCMEAMLRNAIAQAQQSMVGLAPDVMALLSMAGFVTALSIATGAMITSLTLIVMKRFTLRTGT